MGFLKENKERLFSPYDYSCIVSNEQLEILVDAMLETMDLVGLDQVTNIQNLYDIDNIPEEYIDYIASMFGWRKIDYQFSFLTYRDLVKNIVRIYKVKGTPLSYDILFRALGYNITLSELWWDKNGNLVKEKPFGAPDPFSTTRRLNKSNYVQIELTLQSNDPNFPEPFTDGQFIRILFEYLQFLKPFHIKYVPLLVNVPRFTEELTAVDEGIPVIILGENKTVNGIGVDGLFETKIEQQPQDDIEIFGLYQFTECVLPRYNGSMRYGHSLKRSIDVNGVSYPVQVVDRPIVYYGQKCAPITDNFRIVIETTYEMPETKPELRYNGFIKYNQAVPYDPKVRVIQPGDRINNLSREDSYGFGNVWSA